MAGIALLLPDAKMVEQANGILAGRPGHHVIGVQETRIETVVAHARRAIEQGANVIVARGNQASELKNNTNVPVVEIVLSAQELGLMVVRAKKAVEKRHPIIGLCAWKGMLSDTRYFDELFGATVLRIDMSLGTTPEYVVKKALDQGADILISGEKVVNYANQCGVPALYLEATGESLSVALENAEQLYYMSEVEKHNYAQFSTVLDTSSNGIMKVNESGRVMLTNHVMETMLEVQGNRCVGAHLTELMPSLDQEVVARLLAGEQENHSTFLNIGQAAMVVTLEPILIEDTVAGLILSCNQMKRVHRQEQESGFLHGYVAHGTLDALEKRMPGLKQVVGMAKLHAGSSSPILVEGPAGDDVEALCQGIHNYSLRREGPYVAVNINGIREEEQVRVLFGALHEDGTREEGLVDKAQHGTLVIRAAEKLTQQVQYRLLRIMSRHKYDEDSTDAFGTHRADVRIICCTPGPMEALLEQGRILHDLFYLLQTFRLRVPALFARREDTAMILKNSMAETLARYARYHVLSPGAEKAILEYNWRGNRLQLEAFVERMVLTVGKRTITEEYVRGLLADLYGGAKAEPRLEPEQIENEELARLRQTMLKYNGNRARMAGDLGISTTTLWRKMKKYGLL